MAEAPPGVGTNLDIGGVFKSPEPDVYAWLSNRTIMDKV